MRNHFLIIIVFLFISCGEQNKEKRTYKKETEKLEITDMQIDSLLKDKNKHVCNKDVIERYFPIEKEILKSDTIISARNLSISIESRTLDSYVTNEFESDGKKYIDKYRDLEKHLIIKNPNETLIDTVFTKNNFVSLTGQNFLKIAHFHGYWFNNIEKDTIELSGGITKPETDWSIAFYHYFDLKTKTFKTEEYID